MNSSKRETPSSGGKKRASFPDFLKKLHKRRIIETLAAFIGGGWLLLEFVHWILVDHYHLPERIIDLTFVTILGALLCTLIWRWFSGRERPRKLKLERFLIPVVLMVTLGIDIIFLLHLEVAEGKSSAAPPWKNSIAVLPFVDLSPQKDQESFCDGMTVDLITRLSNIKELKVPARTSVFVFKGKTPEPREIQEKLKVQNMLEGEVQKSGNRLRITVQLINLADGYHLWSRKYDKELQDVFDIQDEISTEIANALRLELTSEEKARLVKRGTSDTAAYELYFRGKQFRYKERPKEMLQARDSFEQAIRRDPDYPAAYAGLAENFMVLGLYGVLSRDEAATKANQATRKALELDPDSSEAHVSSGVIKMVFDFDWKGAEREFKQAITLNPNNFDAHREYALLLFRNLRYNESEREFLRSMELDPLNGLPLRDLGDLYLRYGQLDKAKEIENRLGEIDPYWAEWLRAVQPTVEEVEKLMQEQGQNIWSLSMLAKAYYRLGKTKEADQIIRGLEQLYVGNEGDVAFAIADYYSDPVRDKGQALTWLERAVEGRAPGLINISRDQSLDWLRKEPRFQAVLDRVGFAK